MLVGAAFEKFLLLSDPLQRTVQEGCHLCAADGMGRAELIVDGRVAAAGDLCRGQFGNIDLKDGSIIVDERVPTAVVR